MASKPAPADVDDFIALPIHSKAHHAAYKNKWVAPISPTTHIVVSFSSISIINHPLPSRPVTCCICIDSIHLPRLPLLFPKSINTQTNRFDTISRLLLSLTLFMHTTINQTLRDMSAILTPELAPVVSTTSSAYSAFRWHFRIRLLANGWQPAATARPIYP